jgi:two-component sensor histidine kinase
LLLEKIVPEQGEMEDYEVEHQFPDIGRRTMLLNARKVFYEENPHTTLLLGIEDVTERRALEREREELLQQKDLLLREKDMLLEELQHRVANSLQIIAAIILMKSRTVTSEETRLHLQDAHNRVMSVAAVQQHLHVAGTAGIIEMAPYLSKLCASLTISMISNDRPIKLKVLSDVGGVSSRDAVSLGLIVTELVLNAVKHAFLNDKMDHRITVAYDVAGMNWQLSVADNGIGKPASEFAPVKAGLGTSIVKALAQQLDARVQVLSGPQGTTVSVTHATFAKMVQPLWGPTSCGHQFAGMPDDSVRIVGLSVEPGAGGQLVRLRPGLSGNDDDANVRPAATHLTGERQAVMVPGRFTSVKSSFTLESDLRRSSASSLLAASIVLKPASAKIPAPNTRTNASSSTIKIDAELGVEEDGNAQRGNPLHGSACLRSMKKPVRVTKRRRPGIGMRFRGSDVQSADKPEHDHNDQNQAENPAEAGAAVPIVAMIATEAA